MAPSLIDRHSGCSDSPNSSETVDSLISLDSFRSAESIVTLEGPVGPVAGAPAGAGGTPKQMSLEVRKRGTTAGSVVSERKRKAKPPGKPAAALPPEKAAAKPSGAKPSGKASGKPAGRLVLDLAAVADVDGLAQEVTMLRAAIRRLVDKDDTPADVKILAELRHQVEALCRALKTQHELSGRDGDALAAELAQVLDELGDGLGVPR